jgi:hypothetical protein
MSNKKTLLSLPSLVAVLALTDRLAIGANTLRTSSAKEIL